MTTQDDAGSADPADGSTSHDASPDDASPDRARRWHRPGRRATALLLSSAAMLALLLVAMLLPVPYVRLAPGPTFNIIGEHDGQPVLEISGTPTYPTTGHLDMTTVSESGGPRGGLTLGQALVSWVNPEDAVLPRELLYPDDVTGEQVAQRNAVAFSTSQSDAVGAALTYLDRPVDVEVIVTQVQPGSPADGRLQPGDIVLAIDGKPVSEPADVGAAVRGQPPGTTFTVTVRRAGDEQEVEVTSAPSPDDPAVPYLGVAIGPYYTAPFTIDFTLQDIGGPSAGLMFAMGLVDKLTPQDLTGGRFVAGTGTITPAGEVGPIGGIRQKLAGARASGAELFLMPRAHCAEAAGHVPDGLTVVPVDTLSKAVDEVRAWVAGDPVSACPAG